MKKVLFALAAVAMGTAIAPVAQAQTTVVNGCPTTPFSYGTGNNYTPCNTYVQTFTNGGDTVELDSRWHVNGVAAPASVGNTYVFALGSQPLNFDFGVQANYDLAKVILSISLTNLSTGENHTFDPKVLPDNYLAGAGRTDTLQNSERLNYGFLFGSNFNANTDVTYKLDWTVNGNTSTTFAQIGAGTAAVPEPAPWMMMILGFGLIGASVRRRRSDDVAALA
ncbi:MAG: PEPxxWA-CTERM sorting domain-containing protein [Sphingomonas sp.]